MRTGKFPTTYRPAGRFEDGIEFRGKRWKVGEADKYSSSPKVLEALVDRAGLFALETARRLKSSQKVVYTTLPLETCIIDAKTGGKVRERLEASLADAGFELGEVYPQGILALEALLAEGRAEKNDTLLIDGGFNTVNVLFVDSSLRARFYLSYYDRGIKRLLELFREELQADGLGHNLSTAQLQSVFLTKELDCGTEVVSVAEHAERAQERYSEELLEEILQLLKERGIAFRQAAVVGGLSYYLKKTGELLKGKRVVIPETGGEYLNVLGLARRAGDGLIFDLGFGFVKYAEESR
jgi:SAM-dependent methyltransferase